MMTDKRFKCRYCGAVLRAWIPVFEAPNVARLLHHLSHLHPDRVGAYWARMHRDEDIGPVAAEAFEVIEGGSRLT
jgi:hypothetical protein